MATTITNPAVLISAAQKTTLCASGGAMAVATGTGGFMRPPRLLAAVPARVQAVVVAVPVTAAPWLSSGRRGAAMRLQVAASGASADTAVDPQVAASGASGDTAEQPEQRGVSTLSHLLSELLASSPPALTAKYKHVLEKKLAEAADMAIAQDSDKLKIVLAIVRASYGILELACDLYLSLPRLPGEKDFITVCLAAKDRRKDVMTPPMESLLSGKTIEMPPINPELPETDVRFMETIFFATGFARRAAKTLHDGMAR